MQGYELSLRFLSCGIRSFILRIRPQSASTVNTHTHAFHTVVYSFFVFPPHLTLCYLSLMARVCDSFFFFFYKVRHPGIT